MIELRDINHHASLEEGNDKLAKRGKAECSCFAELIRGVA